MNDIIIHRCILRLVRRNGWAWGNDPRQLLAAAVKSLPGLIAGRLAELWPQRDESEITAPVRIRVPLRLEELMNLGQSADSGNFSAVSSSAMQRLDEALRNAVAELCGSIAAKDDEAEDNSRIEVPALHPAPAENEWAAPVLNILCAWWQEQVLGERLLSFTLPVLLAWHDNLIATSGKLAPTHRAPSDEELKAFVQDILAEPFPVQAGRVRTLAQRLLVMAAAAAAHSIAPADARLQHLLAELCPLGKEGGLLPIPPPPIIGDAASGPAQQRPAPAIEEGQVSPPRTQTLVPAVPHYSKALDFELHVQSALPFLLLGPLARIGYLDTLHATLEAAGLSALLPCFPTLLARKALDPPQRGWHYNPATVTAAMALAGLEEPVPEPAIADFARLYTPHLSPLDGLVSDKLVEGHRKGAALLLIRADTKAEHGLWLVDNDGLLPIGWAGVPPRLFRHLARLQGDILLVPAQAAQPEILAQLDEAGFSFVTDAPPTRGEYWRRVPGAGADRLWSNAPRSKDAALLKAAAHLGNAGAEAQELWQQLAVERPAIVVRPCPEIERSLTLAAALALGTLAWTLWHEREPTTPMLALERFGDLDARVRFTRDAVQVRLPMGRRYQDLLDHGLLAEIRRVPWFAGRPLQFSAG